MHPKPTLTDMQQPLTWMSIRLTWLSLIPIHPLWSSSSFLSFLRLPCCSWRKHTERAVKPKTLSRNWYGDPWLQSKKVKTSFRPAIVFFKMWPCHLFKARRVLHTRRPWTCESSSTLLVGFVVVPHLPAIAGPGQPEGYHVQSAQGDTRWQGCWVINWIFCTSSIASVRFCLKYLIPLFVVLVMGPNLYWTSLKKKNFTIFEWGTFDLYVASST